MIAFNSSVVYSYDGSFEGLLSVVYQAFDSRVEPEEIVPLLPDTQLPLSEMHEVETCPKQAERVWNGLVRRSSLQNANLVRIAALSGEPQKEALFWRYIKKLFATDSEGFYRNMLDEDVFDLLQMARRVRHEAHRLKGFARFQQTHDGLWFAPLDPDHDVLRLIAPFFKGRLGDQDWLIYDTKRSYGIWYDRTSLREVVLKDPAFALTSGRLNREAKALDEDLYSRLWKSYYDAVNIQERKNHRQMKRAMPKRYWKYLPEKNRDQSQKYL